MTMQNSGTLARMKTPPAELIGWCAAIAATLGTLCGLFVRGATADRAMLGLWVFIMGTLVFAVFGLVVENANANEAQH